MKNSQGLYPGPSVRRDAASLGNPQLQLPYLPLYLVTGYWRQKVKPLTCRGF